MSGAFWSTLHSPLSTAAADAPAIEGYDLIDEQGRGGMGVVYEAFQRSTGRRVAVKFMLDSAASNDDARRRFEREVELVARLQHPHIVSVLDSGIYRGSYFCVLDFVEGMPLDQHLAPGECDVKQALPLIAQIADAVDYAHQRGVLHRDLKPSNILIDARGEPHILDFGLAKAIDTQSLQSMDNTISRPGQLIGTLGYMAPEQSRGEFDHTSIRSDVYSLGAIAYQILTGRLPCPTNAPLADVLKSISEVDPPRPSAVRPELNSDLNAVLLKALAKNPRERYATAGEFAAEITRCLNDEPILARPPSTVMWGVKWVRRNKTLTAVTTGALAAIFIIAITSFVRIVHSRNEAKKFADALNEAFLAMDVQKANANIPAVINQLATIFDRHLKDYPAKQADFRTVIGERLLGWEQYDQAEDQFRKALEKRQELFGAKDVAVAESLHNLARPIFYLHRYPEAASLYQQALDMRRELLGPTDQKVAETMHHLASTYREMEQYERAETLYRQALLIRLQYPEDGFSIAATRNNLGLVLLRTKRPAEAQPLFVDALAVLRELSEEKRQPLFEARTMQNLGECFMDQNQLDDAEKWLTEALEKKTQLSGPDSLSAAQTCHSLAELKIMQHDWPAARGFAQRAADIRQKRNSPEISESQRLLKQIEDAMTDRAP